MHIVATRLMVVIMANYWIDIIIQLLEYQMYTEVYKRLDIKN